jgi:hypothetical protein
MSVFDRLRMPSLGRATEWLNTEPLGTAELHGIIGQPRWTTGS